MYHFTASDVASRAQEDIGTEIPTLDNPPKFQFSYAPTQSSLHVISRLPVGSTGCIPIIAGGLFRDLVVILCTT